MAKKYSELLEKLELTAEEKKALEELKTCPRYHMSWPRSHEYLMEPIGKVHAKWAIAECLKEAKNLADANSEKISTIHLQNTWFFSFNLFNSCEAWCYAYEMDYELFMGENKKILTNSFNDFVTELFEKPSTFERNGLPGWNWMNIVIEF